MADKKYAIEADLKRLEEIVAKLESPETTLDESMALFDEGVMLSRQCRQELEDARQVVEQRKLELDLE